MTGAAGALLLAGCGSAPSSTGSLPGPVAAPPTAAAPTSDGATGGATGASDAGSPYLPVPDGVVLTEPGSQLDLRHRATVAWNPRQGTVGVVSAKVTRLERTTSEHAFGGYDLDRQTRSSKPYYVRTTVENLGGTDLGGRQLPMYAVTDTGALVQPTAFADRFEPCPDSALPLVFADGAKARTCQVFLLPAGARLAGVEFRPGSDVEPITWSGSAVKVTKDQGKASGKRGSRR